jgi:hypothetical protein
MRYIVSYDHVVERHITCVVEATSEEEAEQKAYEGDTIDTDEDNAPEDGIEIKNVEVELEDES